LREEAPCERADSRSCDDAPLDPACTDAEVVRSTEAWLAFQRALAFEPQRAIARLAHEPDPARALAAEGVLAGLERDADARDRALLARVGARLLPWPSAAYPEALRPLPDAPPVLGVRGDPRVLLQPGVAIVGARAATVDGLDTARSLAFALAQRGLVVVSGLARGIDAAAHRGALEAGGWTIAVQACGPEQVYPREHRELADRIAERGAVVSELPVGSPPRAVHFPLRNRLISGLSLATVVVEARLRSGSLVTAGHALAQGREVLAVPGPLRAATSEGPNRLLRDGARPALDVDDVLTALPEPIVAGLAPSPLAPSPPRPSLERALAAPAPRRLDARDRSLLAALERCAQSRDGLSRSLRWTVSEVAARLLALEVDGLVVQDRDGRFKTRRAVEPRGARG